MIFEYFQKNSVIFFILHVGIGFKKNI